MGFEIVTRVSRDRVLLHKAAFVCDMCGKVIPPKDYSNAVVDYRVWDKLPTDKETREAELNKRWGEKRVITYCPGCQGKRPDGWCDWFLDQMVWDLLPYEDRRKNLAVKPKPL